MPLAAWQSTIVDESGNVQEMASVEVKLESSGALAALFSDRDGEDEIDNPVTAGSDGFVRFYAAGSAYRITATLGAFSRVWRHVSVGLLGENDTISGSDIRYNQTPAEIAAGVTPGDYSIPSHEATGGIFYPERYGTNTTPGTTQMSAIIQAALDVAEEAGGGEVRCSGTNFLGTTAITVGDNVRLMTGSDAKFTATTSVVANMPRAYVVVTGSNVVLEGLFLDYGAIDKYSTYAEKGIFIELSSGVDNLKIMKCRSLGPVHSVWAGPLVTDVTNVEIAHCGFNSHDVDIYYVGLRPEHWNVHDNFFIEPRPQEIRVGGAFYMSPAVDPANPFVFDQENYDTDRGYDISFVNNSIEYVVGRPVRFNNCVKVTCCDNRMTLTHGTYTDPDVGDDAWTFDLVRDLVFNGNVGIGGGENAVDLQSVIGCVMSGNVFRETNTVAVGIAPSDLWLGGPSHLPAVTDRSVWQTRDVEITGNFIHSYHGFFFLGAGQNVHVHGNIWKPYTGSTYNDGTTAPLFASIDTAVGEDLFDEGREHWMHDIKFENNKLGRNPPVKVTASASTDAFTCVLGEHFFATGDQIHLVASGTSTTVDMPGGVTYYQTYHVIRTSATAFKIATSRANAFAGTAVNISSDGLTTGGSALIAKDAPYLSQLSVTAAYYTPDSNFKLDEEFPYIVQNELFSTLDNISTGASVVLERVRHEFVFDPATTYGGGPSQKGAYPATHVIDDRIASDGTDTYGIEIVEAAIGGITFTKSTDITKYPGVGSDGIIRTYVW
jgi:hypothetical protein